MTDTLKPLISYGKKITMVVLSPHHGILMISIFHKLAVLSETYHVFIHGNRLTERFGQLTKNERFVIAETGFGTGLNFWQFVSFGKNSPKICSITLYQHRKNIRSVMMILHKHYLYGVLMTVLAIG